MRKIYLGILASLLVCTGSAMTNNKMVQVSALLKQNNQAP